MTKEGKVLYGSLPKGTICERREPVQGSLTIVSSKTFSSNKDVNHAGSNFKCDGRQHCSQMNSRAEAEYFLKNCPDIKMDGDHDGVPCESDSRF
ncbi:MAG: excalibur calcium-binding domain-containing protein [Gammaproteobacteria bacterium]|nr:excalibur calcium-binding domain-containing protein [Gammaproteobacteria bacterium]